MVDEDRVLRLLRGIAQQLRNHGLPLRTRRTAPARPPRPRPLIADALGFHHATTTRQHANAGVSWSLYAGGGHPDKDQR